MHILSIFGTRPEAIKMAPLIKLLEKTAAVESTVCVTGQHREMLEQVLRAFSITPDYDLSIMKQQQSLSTITTGILEKLESILKEEVPDLILVHGDTTTSLSSALAAFYSQIPIGHVEAGLRTHHRYSPFPEEMNRTLISRLATYHFAPTSKNKEELAHEGITENVWVTGNTVLDSFSFTLKDAYFFNCATLNLLDYTRPTILVTAHRRENIGIPLQNICHAIKVICLKYPHIQVVYPAHLNPDVLHTAHDLLGNINNVYITEPIDVLDMHNLMSKIFFVMTDSGGLQEEAPFLNKPILVLRRDTEREEVVASGAAILVGTEQNNIIEEAEKLLSDKTYYKKIALAPCPYGDGHASERIVQHLLKAVNHD